MIDQELGPVADVGKDPAARLDLGYARLRRREPIRTRAAAAHDVDRMPRRPARLGTLREEPHGRGHRALLLGLILDRRGVALPTHHAREPKPGMLGDPLRQRGYDSAGPYTGAICANVDLDHHP